jgi:hypothetical protein
LLPAQVDDPNRGSQERLLRAKEQEPLLTRGVKGLERRGLGPEDDESTVGESKSHVPRVVGRKHLLLLVGTILFLVHNEEAKIREGEEERGAGPDDRADRPCAHPFPDPPSLPFGKPTVVEGDPPTDPPLEVVPKGTRDEDLWGEEEGAPAAGEGALREGGVSRPALPGKEEGTSGLGKAWEDLLNPVGPSLLPPSGLLLDAPDQASLDEAPERVSDRPQGVPQLPSGGRAGRGEEGAQEGGLAGGTAREAIHRAHDLAQVGREGVAAAFLPPDARRKETVHEHPGRGEVVQGDPAGAGEGLRGEGRTGGDSEDLLEGAFVLALLGQRVDDPPGGLAAEADTDPPADLDLRSQGLWDKEVKRLLDREREKDTGDPPWCRIAPHGARGAPRRWRGQGRRSRWRR